MLKKLFFAALCILAVAGAGVAATDKDTDARIDDIMGAGKHQQYHQFLNDLQQAVADNDKKAVAAMFHYPVSLLIDNQTRVISNENALISVYDKVFDQQLRDLIIKQKYADLFVRDIGVMVGNSGELWYSGVCTNSDCSKFIIKIIAINKT